MRRSDPVSPEKITALPLFKNISTEDQARVISSAESLAVEPGDYIYRQGEKGDYFYIIVEGDVELLVRREDESACMVGRIGTGGHFGEGSLFTGQPRSISVRAVSKARMLRFSSDFFHSVLLAAPAFQMELNRILSLRLRLAFQDQLDIIRDRRQSLRVRPESVRGHPLLADMRDKKSAERPAPDSKTESVSRSAREIQARIHWFAGNLEPLLITGESGTGRRLAAGQIHLNSTYGQGPYTEVDLQQFEPGIWEGKLFGHDKDAFPFAQVRQAGIFEQFRGGTVVLYHAEALSSAVQAQLLETILSGFFHRVAGKTPLKFATRLIFICASDKQPEGKPYRFIPGLQDLLAERTLAMPPLREHKRDIPRLVQHYLTHFNREYNRNVKSISSGALGVLMNYDWPGNMTELGNVIQRAVLLAEEDEILSEQILLGLPHPEGKLEYNLLRWPVVRRMFESRLFPLLPRIIISLVFFGGIMALFFGPQDPEQNIGLVMSWAVGWPLLLFSFFFLGRIWCSVCPLSLPGNIVQTISKPKRSVPDFLKNYSAWIVAFLCIILFWIEIVWDAYQHARLTGSIVLAIALGSFLFSLVFKRRAWCRYICPLGGLNAIFAMPSILELRANRHFCINSCQEHKCYKGGDGLEGCPMFRHPFLVDNNRDCTLCANCIKNCPHGSIQVNLRIAPQELWLIQSPRVADSFLIVALAAILIPLARHEQFLALMKSYSQPHLAGTLILIGLIALLEGAFSSYIRLQARLTRNRFMPVFAATGYGLIPLVLGAFLAVYFEMFVAGAWRFVSLILSPFSQASLRADYRLLTSEATATLQYLIILGGMLAAFYATYRIVKRYTRADGFSVRLFGLPYGFLLGLGILFIILI